MPAKIYHFDLYGKRKDKYEFLKNNSVSTVDWKELKPDDKYHFFVPKDFGLQEEYEKGVKVSELFDISASGMVGGRDKMVVRFNSDFSEIINDFKELETQEIAKKYKLENTRDWNIDDARQDLSDNDEKVIKTIYKAFDQRYTLYTGKTKGVIQYPRKELVKNFIKPNYGLCLMKKIIPSNSFTQVMITSSIIDKNFYSFQTYQFPLYLYPENSDDLVDDSKPRPNFNPEIIKQIEEGLGMKLNWHAKIGESLYPIRMSAGLSKTDTKTKSVSTDEHEIFTPTDLLDYIYSVLHSPTYRERYKEFLKIDFPRIPFEVSPPRFWELVEIGCKLRKLHLMEDHNDQEISSKFGYPESGDNKVEKPSFVAENFNSPSPEQVKVGKVYINDTQYFAGVSESTWNFYIGGYQPAQKWLKDRKGRELSFDDIIHYQKILYVLGESDRVMNEIANLG